MYGPGTHIVCHGTTGSTYIPVHDSHCVQSEGDYIIMYIIMYVYNVHMYIHVPIYMYKRCLSWAVAEAGRRGRTHQISVCVHIDPRITF